MIRLAIFLLGVFIVSVGIYIYFNPEETFQAKFKNIDGLPTGAPVTALGVRIGEVLRTKSVGDGVIVTVRITNKSVPKPPSGSQLAITSFRPGQGRVLEVIPGEQSLPENKDLIVHEPITNETWLHASLDLLDGLKRTSEGIIRYVTPENFQKARTAFSRASESLNETANNLLKHESGLIDMKEKLTRKTSEVNALLIRTRKPIASLNKIINDKNLTASLKEDLREISGNLTRISTKISDPKTINNLQSFKTDILNHLNEVNASLTSSDESLKNSALSKNLKEFSHNLEDLNVFYDELNKKDIQKNVKESVKKAREVTTMLAEKTSGF